MFLPPIISSLCFSRTSVLPPGHCAETLTSAAPSLWEGSNVRVASGSGREHRLPLIPQKSLSMCSSTCQPVGTFPHRATPTSRRGVNSVLWTVLGLFTLGTNRSLIAEAGGAVPRSLESRVTFSLQLRPHNPTLFLAHTPPTFSPFLVVTNMSHVYVMLPSWVQVKDTCKTD